MVHYVSAAGECEEKLGILEALRVDGSEWHDVPNGWIEPFKPVTNALWADCPRIGDILPWHSTGVTPNRSWVIAPSKDTLRNRWARLLGSDPDSRDVFMKVGTRTPDSLPPPIFGFPQDPVPLRSATWSEPHIARIAFRSFDRQYIILDSRVIDRPRSDLWQTVGPKQVFITEQHAHPITGGPGLSFAWHVPHAHHFNGRGGRVLPLYRDPQGIIPNVAPGLLSFLSETLQYSISAEDLLSYIAATVSHSGYTKEFQKELAVPGIRVPLSRDARLWAKANDIGRQVINLHTYGACFASYKDRLPRLGPGAVPKITSPIPYDADNMPNSVKYDRDAEALLIGDTGRITPVPSAIWEYTVGGKAPTVVQRWVGYRLKRPRGQMRSSPLDETNSPEWTLEFNNQLLELLNTLRCLVTLESQQDELLDEILSGPLITETELKARSVLPAPEGATKPLRYRDQPAL